MKSAFCKKFRLDSIRNEVVNNGNSKEVIEEDYLAKSIGAFGLWQVVVGITVTLSRCIAMWNMMSIGFLTSATQFKCVEFSENVTFEAENSTCYENCLRYDYSSVVGRTIIEEFELICKHAWLASFTQSLMMLGLLMGVSLFGWISDRWGRRVAFLLATFLNVVFMVALPFSPSYTIFNCIRFVIGIASGGALIICAVHVLEIVGKQHREIAGACCFVPDGFADATLAGFAYYTSTWQDYTLSYGVTAAVFFVVLVFVPESPRWLVSNGKIDEAVAVMTSAAKRNNMDPSQIKAIVTKVVEDMKLEKNKVVKTTYADFFKSRELAIKMLLSLIVWIACGICYYGIYQYATIISANPYLTVLILGLLQIPLGPSGIVLNKILGRKLSTLGFTAVIGVTMIILIFVPDGHWSVTLLGVLGFVAASITFSILYVYILELFPTPLRNMGLGLASAGAKVGAMIAPFIANLLPRWLPSLIFGILPFVAGACCLLLPETKGRNLKDTVE